MPASSASARCRPRERPVLRSPRSLVVQLGARLRSAQRPRGRHRRAGARAWSQRLDRGHACRARRLRRTSWPCVRSRANTIARRRPRRSRSRSAARPGPDPRMRRRPSLRSSRSNPRSPPSGGGSGSGPAIGSGAGGGSRRPGLRRCRRAAGPTSSRSPATIVSSRLSARPSRARHRRARRSPVHGRPERTRDRLHGHALERRSRARCADLPPDPAALPLSAEHRPLRSADFRRGRRRARLGRRMRR